MKKTAITAAIAAFFLISGAAWSAEKNLDQWVKSVSQKISGSSKEKKHKETSVAGVKGAEEKSGEDLYWKKGAPPESEADEFAKALSLVQEGKNAEALTALENFKKKHPESPLAHEADEGLELLKSASTGKPAPAK